ncbi:hypothetical protein V502_04723 [Pseudogymnoascus sp. VKM F-4520 (FW-2644)]|nr:hypothetical protein V502_04723 [Pseudogymnoascus sp. VKM F-4520 (FW-2644)]
MVSLLVMVLAALPLYWAFTKFTCFRRNLKDAKSTGLPYVIQPVFPITLFWIISGKLWLDLMNKTLPDSWHKSWSIFLSPDWSWNELYEAHRELGTDTFITVSPVKNMMWTADASVIHQITSRQVAFPKPIKDYKVLDIYGRNVVTTEGPEWRMHRKATAPGFNEKNNSLVFTESVAQAQGMIRKWMDGSDKSSRTLNDIPADCMRVALHIISAMGFGVRLLWPGDVPNSEDKDSGLIHMGDKPVGGHTMSFEKALVTVLDDIFVLMLTPKWLLKIAPLKRAKRAWEAYKNWKLYMEELLQKKVEAELAGEKSLGMDIMGALVKSATDGGRPDQKKSPGQLESNQGKPVLTDENIIGNSFVMLIAGHETTANTIHFSLMELAMNPSAQRNLQKEVCTIFGDSDPKTWDYAYSVNNLLGGMVGAVMSEMLRLMPPVTNIPKSVTANQEQTIVVDGQKHTLPKNLYINFNVVGAQRNPKYWPSKGVSKVSGKSDDLDDFIPERWLKEDAANQVEEDSEEEDFGGFTGKSSSAQLFRPPRGAFLPFSDGPRSCLGRRLAQVELIAVLAVIFQKYSIELAVDEWASDEEVAKMSVPEKLEVYAKAVKKAKEVIRTATSMITLKLIMGPTYIPARLVKKGEERFIRSATTSIRVATMSSSSFLQKMRKAQLEELASDLDLSPNGQKKAELEILIDSFLIQHPELSTDARVAPFYKRRSTTNELSPVKREQVSADVEKVAKVTRRRTIKAADELTNSVDDSDAEPATTRARSALTRTPARALSLAQSVPLPPSPSVVADVLERRSAALVAHVTEIASSTGATEAVESARASLSSLLSIETIILFFEAANLRSEILPDRYAFSIPSLPILNTKQYPVALPDLFLLLTSSFWQPFTLWLATALVVPLAFAYFFNLTARPRSRGAQRFEYQFDPLTFNVAKAIITYAVFSGGATFWGLVDLESVARIRSAAAGGWEGIVGGCAVGALATVYEAIIRK